WSQENCASDEFCARRCQPSRRVPIHQPRCFGGVCGEDADAAHEEDEERADAQPFLDRGDCTRSEVEENDRAERAEELPSGLTAACLSQAPAPPKRERA